MALPQCPEACKTVACARFAPHDADDPTKVLPPSNFSWFLTTCVPSTPIPLQRFQFTLAHCFTPFHPPFGVCPENGTFFCITASTRPGCGLFRIRPAQASASNDDLPNLRACSPAGMARMSQLHCRPAGTTADRTFPSLTQGSARCPHPPRDAATAYNCRPSIAEGGRHVPQ